MCAQPRNNNFKLGRLHGKNIASDMNSEAHIQRTIFLSQRMKICKAKDNKVDIRIFAYEVPLEAGVSRGKCADLLGYDQDNNLYIIELKRDKSNENLLMAATQLNGYEMSIKKILKHIEDEFAQAFFFPIKFDGIKKMIIAPREYFNKNNQFEKDFKKNHGDIELGIFWDADFKNHDPKDLVNIHLYKWK